MKRHHRSRSRKAKRFEAALPPPPEPGTIPKAIAGGPEPLREARRSFNPSCLGFDADDMMYLFELSGIPFAYYEFEDGKGSWDFACCASHEHRLEEEQGAATVAFYPDDIPKYFCTNAGCAEDVIAANAKMLRLCLERNDMLRRELDRIRPKIVAALAKAEAGQWW